MQYEFFERLNMSMQGLQLETDIKTLKAYFPDVADVRKTDIEEDKSGIDYVVTLKSGVEIGVDVKTRDKGCSKFWKNGPEIALETWSQFWPDYAKCQNQIGWTVDSRKRCHYIMFKFDKSDSDAVYILPFQQLNKAFRKHMREWDKAGYRRARQTQRTAEYYSECMFVPAKVVMEAVKEEFETACA